MWCPGPPGEGSRGNTDYSEHGRPGKHQCADQGTNSINGNSGPLYVIDGLVDYKWRRDVSPLSTINPNDIESVEVPKDASAAAIYGAWPMASS